MSDEKPKRGRKKKAAKLVKVNKVVKLNANRKWVNEAINYHRDDSKAVMVLSIDNDGVARFSMTAMKSSKAMWLVDMVKQQLIEDCR